jgi:high-affinity iron transporter
MTTGRRSQPIDSQESTQADLQHGATVDEEERKRTAKLLRRMRLQIWAGTLTGFFLALCIGAAFIAVVGIYIHDIYIPVADKSSTPNWSIYGPRLNRSGKVFSR